MLFHNYVRYSGQTVCSCSNVIIFVVPVSGTFIILRFKRQFLCCHHVFIPVLAYNLNCMLLFYIYYMCCFCSFIHVFTEVPSSCFPNTILNLCSYIYITLCSHILFCVLEEAWNPGSKIIL